MPPRVTFSLENVRYFLWCTTRVLRDKTCPFCDGTNTRFRQRKLLVTSLYQCDDCGLMFRLPKGSEQRSRKYYQRQYKEGFTTRCPDARTLAKLTGSGFAGTEKDYTSYMNVIRAAGILPPMKVYDFGCSWGYGSWQLRQAGYDVVSWEISQPRANYARESLGCKISSPESLPASSFDCFFSAHVLEHLDDPKILWSAGNHLLRPGGAIVLFMPNGGASNPNVQLWWNKVHPLLVDSSALLHMAKQSGFRGHAYAEPYDCSEVASGVPGSNLTGDELCLVARRL